MLNLRTCTVALLTIKKNKTPYTKALSPKKGLGLIFQILQYFASGSEETFYDFPEDLHAENEKMV